MNRILKYLGNKRESLRIPDFPIPESKVKTETTDLPSACAFCNVLLRDGEFRAVSHEKNDMVAVVCDSCIRHFAVMSKFSENVGVFWEEHPDYDRMIDGIVTRLEGEPGNARTKEVVAKIVVQSLQRSSSLLAGNKEVCPKTGLSLTPARHILIPINRENPFFVERLVKLACEEVGIAFEPSSPNDLNSGRAFERIIKNHANGERSWAEHAVIFCDGYVPSDAPCTVIMTSSSKEKPPFDHIIYI